MFDPSDLPTQLDLRRLYAYDPDTGHVVSRDTGKMAGHLNRTFGYRYIQWHGRNIREHRLVWAWVHGVWPIADLDHINGDRQDNRLSNLRPATRRQNCFNRRLRKSNGLPKGVCIDRTTGKYRANIKIDGIARSLGAFKTEKAAHFAYYRAAKKYAGEFAKS